MAGAQEIVNFEKRFSKVRFAAGEIIFREGEPLKAAYIIHEGAVTISTINVDMEQVILTTMHKGQVFGDLALINQGKHSATATAKEDCELIVVHPEQLRVMLKKAEPFLRFWIEYLGQRVIDLTHRIDQGR